MHYQYLVRSDDFVSDGRKAAPVHPLADMSTTLGRLGEDGKAVDRTLSNHRESCAANLLSTCRSTGMEGFPFPICLGAISGHATNDALVVLNRLRRAPR